MSQLANVRKAAVERAARDLPPRIARSPGRSGTEPPQRAAERVFGPARVLPAPVVAHEVVEPPVVLLRVDQEAEVRRGELGSDCLRGPAARRFDRHDQRARNVVRTVAEAAVGDVVACVLKDADVVGHRDEMVEHRVAGNGHDVRQADVASGRVRAGSSEVNSLPNSPATLFQVICRP